MRLVKNRFEALDEDQLEEPGEFFSALETIDASMKPGAPMKAGQVIAITPEALAQIVSKAVADAIAEYERTRGDLAPRPAASQAATPPSPWRTKLSRLQVDMGLDEIEFVEPATPPASLEVPDGLAEEMGLDGFAFDDPVELTTADDLAPEAAPAPEPPPPAVEKTLTPEEAAATIFFTFEPMPPVPPPVPREPRQD